MQQHCLLVETERTEGMTKSDGLQSDKPYESGNVQSINSSITYQRGYTRMSRTPGPSDGFSTEDGGTLLGISWKLEEPLKEEAVGFHANTLEPPNHGA
ncbi:hypothetical protein OIDMADRAFT_183959 [Oidiodendron maius Zn]|uniref:Uncharacterized protein n=1 Tax=Oidiodendron maius (strain Zn) TaxID=913774 RepID=A0A0C3GW63_OIDMZ|nr:hypothetical protein OIDMADRAFT_183959 [Oidiodendron maius Zn]